jgi:hypothetical protein
MDFAHEYVKHMKVQTQMNSEERRRTLMHNQAQEHRELLLETLLKLQNGGMQVDKSTVQSMFSVGGPAQIESGANVGELDYMGPEPDDISE